MKRFSEQLKKQSNQTRLSVAEKGALKERLTAYMEYHPLPKERAEMTKTASSTMVSESFTLVRFNTPQVRNFLGAFTVLLVIIVPVVAERAVPGDVLYPVKVQFNEEIRGTLTLSPYQKVEWETERLERRIAEARLLSSEGKLTEEVQAKVAKAVKEHSDAAQAEIATIAESDSDEAALAGITFNAALEVQSEVLESDIENGIGGDELALVVGEAIASAEPADDQVPSFEKTLARLEIETTRATEFFNSITEVASVEEQADIERRLEDIARKVDEALALQQSDVADDQAAAVELLTQSLSDTRKLISFMTDIDVKETVEVEDLVPVVLTLEERVAAVEAALTAAADEVTAVETAIANLEDEALLEKTTFGLETAVAALAIASTSLASTTFDIDVAETAATEATDVLADLTKTLLLAPTAPTESVVPAEEATTTPEILDATATSTPETETETDEVVTEEPVEEEVSEVEPVEAETETVADTTGTSTDEVVE